MRVAAPLKVETLGRTYRFETKYNEVGFGQVQDEVPVWVHTGGHDR